MQLRQGEEEVHTKFWWRGLWERGHVEKWKGDGR